MIIESHAKKWTSKHNYIFERVRNKIPSKKNWVIISLLIAYLGACILSFNFFELEYALTSLSENSNNSFYSYS